MRPPGRPTTGLAGQIVAAIAPHTESDPVALLTQLLVFFGNAVGGAPHFMVEADRHAVNLFLVLVPRDAPRGRRAPPSVACKPSSSDVTQHGINAV